MEDATGKTGTRLKENYENMNHEIDHGGRDRGRGASCEEHSRLEVGGAPPSDRNRARRSVSGFQFLISRFSFRALGGTFPTSECLAQWNLKGDSLWTAAY